MLSKEVENTRFTVFSGLDSDCSDEDFSSDVDGLEEFVDRKVDLNNRVDFCLFMNNNCCTIEVTHKLGNKDQTSRKMNKEVSKSFLGIHTDSV